MWNRSTCNCECNKACRIYEYLDTKNFSSKKRPWQVSIAWDIKYN